MVIDNVCGTHGKDEYWLSSDIKEWALVGGDLGSSDQ